MTQFCPLCSDSGLRLTVGPDGERYARACECRLQLQATRLLKRASIPKRYEHCTLDTFEPDYGQADRSLSAAYMMARNFVAGYPVTTEGKGLLLTGDVGTGKTHLATGLCVAACRGVRGITASTGLVWSACHDSRGGR